SPPCTNVIHPRKKARKWRRPIRELTNGKLEIRNSNFRKATGRFCQFSITGVSDFGFRISNLIEELIMALKNMKNVDFKHFFLHKGEKVALWICVGLMALLVVLMVKDVVAGPSAGANTEKLTNLSKGGKQKIDSANPDPKLGDLDPQIRDAA